MNALTHKNLPLAIFLERGDLGYPAWTGGTSAKVMNSQIISSLGLGIVRFSEATTPPEAAAFDYEYRTDTDVVSSVEVFGGQADPDNPVSVEFTIDGKHYNVRNVYYPDGGSQLVWVKWHTPKQPCEITIAVSVSGSGYAQSQIRCKVEELVEKTPPNPTVDDRNDTFVEVNPPQNTEKTTAEWGVWSASWQENWEWQENWQKCWHSEISTDENGNGIAENWYHWVDYGEWVDNGWWDFTYNSYSARLTANMQISVDSNVPTKTLKSGYGIQEKVTARVTSTQNSAVTAPQTAVTYFPEFQYKNYFRLLDRTVSGSGTVFEFAENPFSTYANRTHFTPIWYPNGGYTPYTYVLDCWTPTGMLSLNLTDSVKIQGNLWDDWHIAPAK